MMKSRRPFTVRRIATTLLLLVTAAPSAFAQQKPMSAGVPDGVLRQFGSEKFRGPLNPWSFSFSPDGKLLAVGADRRVDILDVATGERVHRFDEHTGRIFHVAFSADGKTLFVADGSITYWHVATGRRAIPQPAGARRARREIGLAAVSGDRRWIATSWFRKDLRITRWNSTKVETSIPQGRSVRAMALSHDGGLLAVARQINGEHRIRVWDRSAKKVRWEFPGHKKVVSGLVFSNNAKQLYSTGHDGQILRWDLVTGKPLKPIRKAVKVLVPDTIMAPTLSPDGKTLAAAVGLEVHLFDAATSRVRVRLNRFYSYLRAVAFSPDGKLLVAGGRGNSVPFWDAVTGRPIHEHQGHVSPVVATAASKDGKRLVTLGQLGRLCVWNRANGRLLRRSGIRFQCRNIRLPQVAFLADDRRVVINHGTLTLAIWDSESDKVTNTIPSEQYRLPAVGSPHGYFARALISGDIEIPASQFRRNVIYQQKPVTMHGHRGQVTALAMSADGLLLASAGTDKTLRIWRASDGEPLKRVAVAEPIRLLEFSPNGKRLAAAVGNVVEIRDAANGDRLLQMQTRAFPVTALAFSPNAKLLATAGGGKEIQIWNTATGKKLKPIVGPEVNVLAVAFSPNGKQLAAAGSDKSVRTFDVATGKLVATLAGHTTGVSQLKFASPTQLISGSRGGEVLIWNTAAPRDEPRRSSLKAGITDLVLSQNSQYLMAVAGPEGLLRIDVTKPADRGRMLMFSRLNALVHFTMSPDERLIAVEDRRELRLFELATGKPVTAMSGSCPVFSTDDRRMYYVCKNGRKQHDGIVAWNLKTNSEEFRMPPEQLVRAMSLEATPDGTQLIAVAAFGRTIQHWDIASRRPLRALKVVSSLLYDSRLTSDGQFLGGIASRDTFELMEPATGQIVFRLPKLAAYPTTFRYLENDTVATGMDNGTVLVRSLMPPGLDSQKRLQSIDTVKLKALWKDLHSNDGPTAYSAMMTFVLLRDRSIPFLTKMIKPSAGQAADAKTIAALIAQLDSKAIDVRRKASERLKALGKVAFPHLQKALEGPASASAKLRIRFLLLSKPGEVTSAGIAPLRAIHVLQRIGTPKAKKFLTQLAKGNASARQTQEAQKALRVMSNNSSR